MTHSNHACLLVWGFFYVSCGGFLLCCVGLGEKAIAYPEYQYRKGLKRIC